MAEAPDEFLPDLATSLSNQSLTLGEVSRREDALAAIDEADVTYRGLAAERSDAFLTDLATALNHQSDRLSELERRGEAITAIEEALNLVLPRLEQAQDVRSDAGLKVVRAYLRRSREADRGPIPNWFSGYAQC